MTWFDIGQRTDIDGRPIRVEIFQQRPDPAIDQPILAEFSDFRSQLAPDFSIANLNPSQSGFEQMHMRIGAQPFAVDRRIEKATQRVTEIAAQIVQQIKREAPVFRRTRHPETMSQCQQVKRLIIEIRRCFNRSSVSANLATQIAMIIKAVPGYIVKPMINLVPPIALPAQVARLREAKTRRGWAPTGARPHGRAPRRVKPFKKTAVGIATSVGPDVKRIILEPRKGVGQLEGSIP